MIAAVCNLIAVRRIAQVNKDCRIHGVDVNSLIRSNWCSYVNCNFRRKFYLVLDPLRDLKHESYCKFRRIFVRMFSNSRPSSGTASSHTIVEASRNVGPLAKLQASIGFGIAATGVYDHVSLPHFFSLILQMFILLIVQSFL